MSSCAICETPTSLGCIRCGTTVCAEHQARVGVCTACAAPTPRRASLLGLAAACAVLLPLAAGFAFAFARITGGNPYNFRHTGDPWSYLCGLLAVAMLLLPPWTWIRVSRRAALRLRHRERLPAAVARIAS